MSVSLKRRGLNRGVPAPRSSRALQLYVLKCLLGTLICYQFYVWLPGHQLYWSIVSVLLVLAPEPRDSVHLSLTRIWANAIGAAVGLVLYLAPLHTVLALCLGVVATILVCHVLALGHASRTALAALVIVFIQQSESRQWTIALERVGSVLLGCLVALALTLVFQGMERRFGRSGRPGAGRDLPAGSDLTPGGDTGENSAPG